MGADRLTDEERLAVDQALAEGRYQRVEPRRAKVKDVPADHVVRASPASRTPPTAKRLPEQMSVWQALQWAFGAEQAQMDADEMSESTGGYRRAVSPEAVLEQRFMLGNVAIDTTPGKSSPADDAEIIASVVRSTYMWSDALWIADLARAGRSPDAMTSAVPHLAPAEWTHGRGGPVGRRADSSEIGTRPDRIDPRVPVGWPHTPRRNRKGVVVHDTVWYTPCTWTPTASQIGAARRAYLNWWGKLLHLQVPLRASGLTRFEISSAMPPMTPWVDREKKRG